MARRLTHSDGSGSSGSKGSSRSRTPDSADVGLRRRKVSSYDDLLKYKSHNYDNLYDDDEADEMEQLLVKYWGNRPVNTGPWKADMHSESCHRCGKKVYPVERLDVGVIYHRSCFKCRVCNRQLTLQTFQQEVDVNTDDTRVVKEVYCNTHVPRSSKGLLDKDALGIRSALEASKRLGAKGAHDQPAADKAFVFKPEDSPGMHYANNATINRYSLRRRSTLRSFSDFERHGIFEAQQKLEGLHRSEEDQLYKQMFSERTRHIKVLDEVLNAERERKVQELIAWFERKKAGQKQREAAIKKFDKYFRAHREAQVKALLHRLVAEEQSAVARLVDKHSTEMIALIREKEENALKKANKENEEKTENGQKDIQTDEQSKAGSQEAKPAAPPAKTKSELREEAMKLLEKEKRIKGRAELRRVDPSQPQAFTEPTLDDEKKPVVQTVEEEDQTRQPPKMGKDDLYTTPDVFKEQDNRAIQESKREHRTFTDLVRRLSHRCETELQKVRAIYRWVTIKDLNKMKFDEELDPESPLGILRGIKYGTESYHDLFKRLCSYAGLECEVVDGFSKGAGYKPGEDMSAKMFRNQWTAVWVEGGWRFINCKWGARHVRGVKATHLTYKCDEFYFLTDPRDHIYQHFPDDPNWQLLDKPITLKTFITLPVVKSPFFNNKFSFSKPTESVIQVPDGNLEIRLECKKMLPVAAKLQAKSRGIPKEILNERCLVRSMRREIIVLVNLPCTGNYYLDLYVANDWQADNMDLMCSFMLKCTGVSRDANITYPQVPMLGRTPFFVRYGMNEESHPDPLITANGEQVISLKLNPEKPVKMSHSIRRWDVRDRTMTDQERYAFPKVITDSLAVYVVRPPRRGFYVMSIYAVHSEAGDQDPKCVYRYCLDCRAPSLDTLPLPKATRRWRYCKLVEPHNGDLFVKTDVKFRIDSHRLYGCAVVIGDRWTELKVIDNKTWTGTINTGRRPDKLSVYGRFERDREKYVPMLEYKLKEKKEAVYTGI